MRVFLAVALLAVSAANAATPASVVDLDKPGALEALKQTKPVHYAKVVESMDNVQSVPYSPKGQRDLRLEPKPGSTGTQVETSSPAKTRLTIPIDGLEYRITVLYTKHPATLTPAK